ncbi:MAG: proton-conducting transporter membrane subunit [Candidatus Muiribacteriaceae bacterium]
MDRLFLLLFPLIPVFFGMSALLIKLVLRKDISVSVIWASSAIQAFWGTMLAIKYYRSSGVYVEKISALPFSIAFGIDRFKIYFLLCYTITLLYIMFSGKIRNNFRYFYTRMLFLFFMTGCSGLLITADVFNFYVLYELMIMSAYAIIAENRKYYPALKYMLFGILSSVLFLIGMVLFYYVNGHFIFMQDNIIVNEIMLFVFAVAFSIKAGLFPSSSWVADCHSACSSLFSVCLSAFPITTGIYGLLYFVVLPAEASGNDVIMDILMIISVSTMLIISVFSYFEKGLKRTVAFTSTLAMATALFMIVKGQIHLGLLYLVFHAFYKGGLFLVLDDMDYKRPYKKGIRVGFTARVLFIVLVFFAAGFYPTYTFMIKNSFIHQTYSGKLLLLFQTFCVFAAFFKYRFVHDKEVKHTGTMWVSIIALIYIVKNLKITVFFDFEMEIWAEMLIVYFIFLWIPTTYASLPMLHNLGEKIWYRSLNHELFYATLFSLYFLLF